MFYCGRSEHSSPFQASHPHSTKEKFLERAKLFINVCWEVLQTKILSSSKVQLQDPIRCHPPRPRQTRPLPPHSQSCRCLGFVCVWTEPLGDDELGCEEGRHEGLLSQQRTLCSSIVPQIPKTLTQWVQVSFPLPVPEALPFESATDDRNN